MKSSIIKRSVVVGGHKTSIALEDAFWSGLKEIAQAQGASVARTVTEIDTMRQQKNLSSAIRLFVLAHIRDQKMKAAFESSLGRSRALLTDEFARRPDEQPTEP
jgi:predicted DNA-binding ribbon-helix-helix protein